MGMSRLAPRPRLAVLATVAAALASGGPGPAGADPFGFDLDGTRVVLRLDPVQARISARAIVQGHARVDLEAFELRLHSGFEVVRAVAGTGPTGIVRDRDRLLVELPRVVAAGERFRVVLDYGGSLFDPVAAPGPGRGPPRSGVGAHLGPETGLALPRECFWYPRPVHRDPQELAVRVEMPSDWMLVARGWIEHEVPAGPAGVKAVFLRSRGMAGRPMGLAAGPYLPEARRFGPAEVRWIGYRRELAEHAGSSRVWPAIDDLMRELGELLGEPGRGRLDVVELAGSLPRDLPTVGLAQGAFLWFGSPGGGVDLPGLVFLGRELSRFWLERRIEGEEGLRYGLGEFATLLAIRRIAGEEAFLARCREAALRYGRNVFPGNEVLSPDPAELEIAAAPPDPLDSGRGLVVALLSILQRVGEERVRTGLSRFMREFRDREAWIPDLLDALEGAAGGRIPKRSAAVGTPGPSPGG